MGVLTLGPEGTFSHQAATLLFPKEKVVFTSTITEVFMRLSDPQFSAGVIPLDNAFLGFKEETISNLMKYEFSLSKKIELKTSLCLAGESLDIEHLYAHESSLEMCPLNIKKHCPKAKVIKTLNNAYSAIQYLAHPKNSAALLPSFSLKFYDLPVLVDEMQDDKESQTTFFAISREKVKKGSKSYASCFLLFSEEMASTKNQIYAQSEETKVPILKLKNLVLQEGETPLYFIETEGHFEEKSVHAFYKALSEKFLIKPLGSYPV